MTAQCKCNPCNCAPTCNCANACGCQQTAKPAGIECGADCACGCNARSGKTSDNSAQFN